MSEKFPGEEDKINWESKEQRVEWKEESWSDNETGKDLDALNASVLLSQGEKDRMNAEQYEKQHSKEDINTLHSEVERNSQITGHKAQLHKEKSLSVNYENMTEEEIEERANEGRKESVSTVQNMIERSSMIPSWLKKMTNS